MALRTASLLLLVLLLGTHRAPPAEAQGRRAAAGLVVGLETVDLAPEPLPYYAGPADSLAAPELRTLVFMPDADSFALALDAPELLLARDDGLWQAGLKRSLYNNWVEDFPWSAPLGKHPSYTGIDAFNGEQCMGHRTHRLRFATEQLLAFEQRSSGFCEGALHPWTYATLAVVPLDSTAHLGLSMGEVLGLEAEDAFYETATAFLEGQPDSLAARFAAHPDPANWTLRRREGRWRAFGRLEGASAAEGGIYADLPLGVEVPQTRLPLAWKVIADRVPQARDAVALPNTRWLLVLAPGRLTAHRWADGTLEPAQWSLPVGAHASLVHVQPIGRRALQTYRQQAARSASVRTP